jgi:intein/homing endonuclease
MPMNYSKRSKARVFTQEFKNRVLNEYSEGVSQQKLSSRYNISRASIRLWLKKSKTYIRPNRTYELDEALFDTIDSEEKAYILGLLYADGCLQGTDVEIALQEKDRELLEKVSIFVYNKIVLGFRSGKEFVSTNGKLYLGQSQVRFRICSRKVTNCLRKHGLCENKSFKIRMPSLHKDLVRHFIRGYFDGDGCLHINKSGLKSKHSIELLSNEDFCEDMKLILNTLGIESNIENNKNTGIKGLRICKSISRKKFLDWIYKDATMFLERKHKLYVDNYL